MKNQYLIEHLLRLSLTIKLFKYSQRNGNVYDFCQNFIKDLDNIIDDITEIHQSKTNIPLEMVVGESITINELSPFIKIMDQSREYIENNSDETDEFCKNHLLYKMSKFIHKLKFLS